MKKKLRLTSSPSRGNFQLFAAMCLIVLGLGQMGQAATSYHLVAPAHLPTLALESSTYFIDEEVADGAQLAVASLPSNEEVYHLYSHGLPGQLLIAGRWRDAPEIAHWLSAEGVLTGKTHLNIYGCNFARGDEGQAATHYLEKALGVSIAASDDITGIDGDWELEVGSAMGELKLTNYGYNLQCADPADAPIVTADAIQASCTPDGDINGDAYIQLSAATGGLSYSINEGNSYNGSGAITSLLNANYPLLILTGLPNPAVSQVYTIRVFDDEVGASTCFTDFTVTLDVQDCVVGCACKEFIYLNERSGGGQVHKYEIEPTGDLAEVFVGGNSWYPGNYPVSELTDPHGLGADLNGFLYIGETANGDVRKLSCDGELFQETGTSDAFVINNGSFNIATYENRLFLNRNDAGIAEYDLCTGNIVGTYTLEDSPGDQEWGLTISGSTLYVSRAFLSGNNRVYRFDVETMPLGSSIPPLISEGTQAAGTLAVNDNFLPRTSLYGITVDPAGNIYLVENDRENEIASSPMQSARILKYSPNGVLLATSDWDTVEGMTYPGETDNNNRGFFNAAGIVFSEVSGLLYVSTQSPIDDCVAIIDPNTMAYLGAAVPFTNTTSRAKGIAVLKECCPTNNRIVVDTTLCNVGIGEKIFLQQLVSCDGTICAGTWDAPGTNSGLMYDGCDNSLTITADVGCGTFTLDFDGTGENPSCGAFTITVNVAIGEVEAAIFSGDQQICAGADPEAFMLTSTAMGSGPLEYQWFVSTESDATGFSLIEGATTATYDPTPADITADTVYFRQVVSVDGCNGAMCTDTSNSVLIITVLDVIVDAGDDVRVCSTRTIDLGAASITPADFMAMDNTLLGATWTSSGTGMFFDNGGAMLSAPVRLRDAISYQPSAADATAGEVTLALTSDDLSAPPFNVLDCVPVADEVTITILNVDCGVFPWSGN